ncbi:CatB-related O-acetyltransferase [Sulfitobacter albidus]|uniref:CatB-related O-acetyltransferase n=1 Tax=Sulfitobacter albidus TaxID=2829501 RepID=A0A975PM05_9RHOB|nr:CatB-related O-acetyltransferase [Sulfitobacter albidus]QUJ75725.1 CatB-related O-acetyltransferase [Sulfitobacter albidus]
MHAQTLSDAALRPGTVFLADVIDHPRVTVGRCSYASAHQPPGDWAAHLAPYLYDFSPEQLILGQFCQIADGVQFITASANHRFDGISSFPFAIFDDAPMENRPSLPAAGQDTTVGHDVWIGQGARILPGTRIGNGVIVGAGAVVAGDIPDYAIVAGNPARILRMRFTSEEIATLNRIAWWDWPIEMILAHEALICGGDVAGLASVARTPPGSAQK